jgi:GNAT superfamily N-acetyltransferase
MSLRLLQAAEIAGWRDTWAAAPADLARRAGIAHEQHGDVLATAVTTAPGRLTTHVLGLTDHTSARREALAAGEAFCARHGVDALVALPEGSRLEAELAARGYARDYVWTKFARDTSPAPDPGCELDIRPVAPADAARMGAIVTTSFGLPADLGPWFAALVGRSGWHVLGAYDGPELVATGSLFAHGDVGWVTWGATDPGHRGRRAQKALLAARIDAARVLGLRAVVTETGEPEPGGRDASYRNILAAGFRKVYRRPFWRLPQPASRRIDTWASTEEDAVPVNVPSTGGTSP